MASHTQSKELSPGCGVAFCAVFFLAGCIFLVGLGYSVVIPEWRANNYFVEHTCVVLDKRIDEHAGDDGPTYRPEFLIRYSIAGRDYEVWTYEATRHYSSGRKGKKYSPASWLATNILAGMTPTIPARRCSSVVTVGCCTYSCCSR
jgi:hypothetical protein